MPDDEKQQPPAGGEEQPAEEKAEAPAQPEAKVAQPAEGEAQAEAKPTEEKQAAQPAAEKKAEAKPKAEEKADGKQPPPAGSIFDLIKQALPDTEMEAHQGFTNVIVEIKPEDVPAVMPVLRDDERLDLKFLRVLFGVDLPDEDAMEVVYELHSLAKNHGVTVKTRVPRDKPKVASVADLWKAADWHERETRDMFGIEFEGHPHLVPLLLPEDMTDHFPLRKDNPLQEIEEWQTEKLGAAAGGDDGGDE
jgi:NADH-quinone oxidoreductase subunit C